MKIWLTGGSGSGKSRIASLFAASGFVLVDADAISRKIAEPDGAAYPELLAAFGPDFLLPDGRLDRRALGQAVFTDPERLTVLNQISHKYIIEEMIRQGAGKKNVLMDAPLPNTFGVPCDKTLFVTAPQEVRIARIMARDGISEEAARARIEAQVPDAVYEKMADAVLYNSGTFEETAEKAKKLIKEWYSA